MWCVPSLSFCLVKSQQDKGVTMKLVLVATFFFIATFVDADPDPHHHGGHGLEHHKKWGKPSWAKRHHHDREWTCQGEPFKSFDFIHHHGSCHDGMKKHNKKHRGHLCQGLCWGKEAGFLNNQTGEVDKAGMETYVKKYFPDKSHEEIVKELNACVDEHGHHLKGGAAGNHEECAPYKHVWDCGWKKIMKVCKHQFHQAVMGEDIKAEHPVDNPDPATTAKP